jgi:peptide chain release factor subunit 1
LISLYVPVKPGRTDRRAFMTRVASLLDRIRPLAEDSSLEHGARVSLREDIAKIEKSLGEEPRKPGAVAVFACDGNGVYEEVWLPRGTRERIVVDADPYVRPMLGVFDEYYRTCAVIVDKGAGQVREHCLDQARELKAVRERTLRKPNYAEGLAEDQLTSWAVS